MAEYEKMSGPQPWSATSTRMAAQQAAALPGRPSPSTAFGRLHAALNQRPQAQAIAQLQQAADRSPQVTQLAALAAGLQNRPGSAATMQRRSLTGEEALQGKFDGTQLQQGPAAKANYTGLPDRLKSGVEARSGLSMNDVRVHRNSPKPAQLQALAYAQGTDIHLGPGQERHLPHEAWHVVQQKQGRVRATRSIGGVAINDERSLEHEASSRGPFADQSAGQKTSRDGVSLRHGRADPSAVVQRITYETPDGKVEVKTAEEAKRRSIEFAGLYLYASRAGKSEIDRICSESKSYESLDSFLNEVESFAVADRMTEGDYMAATSTRFQRADSVGNLLEFNKVALHEEMQDRNIKMAAATGATTENFVRMAISIDYRLVAGDRYVLGEKSAHINHSWNSGATQYGVDQSGKYDRTTLDNADDVRKLIQSSDTKLDVDALPDAGLPSTPYRESAFVSDGNLVSFAKLTSKTGSTSKEASDWAAIRIGAEAAGYSMETYLKGKATTKAIFKKEGHETLDYARAAARNKFAPKTKAIPKPAEASDILVRPEPHAHSEVSAAADSQVQVKIDEAVSNIRRDIPPEGVIVNLTIAANSHPNTMCKNFCRSALRKIDHEFGMRPLAAPEPRKTDDPKANGESVGSYGGRVSARFGYVLQVSATKLFGKSMIRHFDSTEMEGVPFLREKRRAIEVTPSALSANNIDLQKQNKKRSRVVSESTDKANQDAMDTDVSVEEEKSSKLLKTGLGSDTFQEKKKQADES